MAGSVSPAPSFHLCPDFNIAPPPDGHLQLGSILRRVDIDGVLAPLDFGYTQEVSEAQLLPRDGPQEKTGFVRKLKELRSMEGSIWAKIFGSESLGASFEFLRKRQDDEILKVDKVLVRYFIPTMEYVERALTIDSVAFYVRNTKMKKPVYLVTSLMWTEGAELSKAKSASSNISAQASAANPNSGTTTGAKGGRESESSSHASFSGSKPFILGIRVRKIWWDKNGVRQAATDVMGATLEDTRSQESKVLEGMNYADDNIGGIASKVIVDETSSGEPYPVVWVLS